MISLEREAQIRAEWILCRHLPEENAKLKHLVSSLQEENRTQMKLGQAQQSEPKQAEVSAKSFSNMTHGALLEEIGKMKGEAAEVEIRLAGMTKKSELLEGRVKELEVVSKTSLTLQLDPYYLYTAG